MITMLPDKLSPHETNCLLSILASHFDHDRIPIIGASKGGQNRKRLPLLRSYVRYPSISCTKWRIFGGAALGRSTLGCVLICPMRRFRFMQQETSLYNLQTNEPPNTYAIVGDFRLTVDRAQAVVHFYQGKAEWGRLVRSILVDKWSGDWLIRTVGRFFKINYQLDENKAIATIQQNGYLTVVVAHRIGQATLYKRLLIDAIWDYAIVCWGDIGFGVTVEKAIVELRQRLTTRIQEEQAGVVLRVGAGSRFSNEALVDFCEANGLTPGGRYTKQQLRQAVLNHRKLNCEQFRDQLNYFGIRVNCR